MQTLVWNELPISPIAQMTVVGRENVFTYQFPDTSSSRESGNLKLDEQGFYYVYET